MTKMISIAYEDLTQRYYYQYTTDDLSNKNIFKILSDHDWIDKSVESKMDFDLPTNKFCKQCVEFSNLNRNLVGVSADDLDYM